MVIIESKLLGEDLDLNTLRKRGSPEKLRAVGARRIALSCF